MPTLWPEPDARDPWDDRCWPSLDKEQRFSALWAAWNSFRADPRALEAFEEEATAAGLTDPLLEDRNTPEWGLVVPSLADLARIAADPWPAVGADGPDLVLGPRSLEQNRLLRLAAVAGCAFVLTEGRSNPSFQIWSRGKPVPRESLRASIRAVGLAPWSLWERNADGSLRDVVGLGPVYTPQGEVEILGLPVDRYLAARVFRGEKGWVAHCTIPLTELPDPPTIAQWIRHETWLARTFKPGITNESLLRKRPILVRKSIEWAADRASNVL